MTYATISTILMLLCFFHFVIPPVSRDARGYMKFLRALLAMAPVLLTVNGMIFASSIAAQVIFGILFGSIMTFAIIRVIDQIAERNLSDKTKHFQARAEAYNKAHEACDELLRQRAMHLQQYEVENEADLELVARLDLETRSAFDRLSEAVGELQKVTGEFPSAQTAAHRAQGQLSMFKNAIHQIREQEMRHGWHEEEVVEIEEKDVDQFRNFLDNINPDDFAVDPKEESTDDSPRQNKKNDN